MRNVSINLTNVTQKDARNVVEAIGAICPNTNSSIYVFNTTDDVRLGGDFFDTMPHFPILWKLFDEEYPGTNVGRGRITSCDDGVLRLELEIWNPDTITKLMDNQVGQFSINEHDINLTDKKKGQ